VKWNRMESIITVAEVVPASQNVTL
jgi:hypothetical protein